MTRSGGKRIEIPQRIKPLTDPHRSGMLPLWLGAEETDCKHPAMMF
jgi:hypothetical protein